MALFSFTRRPVTFWTTVAYFVLIVPLLVTHLIVPRAPLPKSLPPGLNLTEAWHDLQFLTAVHRPYNSHRNDEVRQWLVQRIEEVVSDPEAGAGAGAAVGARDVEVFEDNQSKLMFSGHGIGKVAKAPTTGVYYESTNIIVYVRGRADAAGAWWEDAKSRERERGGVLVNSHYDSVSTGYGATDDGVAVVTMLQLLKYFTRPENRPRRGLVLLFNNGEEDFLNGAHVFTQHPLSNFSSTFVNLEGAGAGGRAVLFRSTDTEVTRFYKSSPHPFGSVVGSDGFKLGLIRSETDYAVFAPIMGLRGLDVAFMEPRSRYHTTYDDMRHTSLDSVWHMLSAAVSTTKGLASYTGSTFDAPESPGKGSTGVWFDIFGSAFAVFQLHTLFALSVTLLVVAPLVLFATAVAASKCDRMYLFAMSKSFDGERVQLQGLRGLWRMPVVLVVAAATPVGLAFWIDKINPQIISSSPFAVWAMMLSGSIFVAWFLLRVADFWRPSALHRAYGYSWLFLVFWVLLVVNTVYVNQHDIAAGYFILFYFSSIFLATWTSYLELFALPRKREYARRQIGGMGSSGFNSSARMTPTEGSEPDADNDNDDNDEAATGSPVNETTSLLRARTTFANYTHARVAAEEARENDRDRAAAGPGPRIQEQPWSTQLPSWTWFLQLLLAVPINVVLVGQVGLLLVSATGQVGADGASVFFPYMSIALTSVLLLTPSLPFLHRFTHHIPVFLLAVLVGTATYALFAFPFSTTNPLKVFFIQRVDLDKGTNTANLVAIQPFANRAIAALPSAAGKNVSCTDGPFFNGRTQCSWPGLPVAVVPGQPDTWLSFNITSPPPSLSPSSARHIARFRIDAANTRSCRILLDTPATDWAMVHPDAPTDPRLPHTGPLGVSEVRLWRREWNDKPWTVDVRWDGSSRGDGSNGSDTRRGRVVCVWSDANDAARELPAVAELRRFLPAWAVETKLGDGLVEVSRRFEA